MSTYLEATYDILLRNSNLSVQAQIDTPVSNLQMVLKFNDVSTWQMTVDLSNVASAKQTLINSLLDFGNGVVIRRNGLVLLSGPVRQVERSYDGSRYKVVVSGTDDTTVLADTVCLPVVSGPPYTASAWDVRTGAAETIMRQYVLYNAGASARSDRVRNLNLAADGGRGKSMTYQARFCGLLRACQEIALAGGDLGFNVVQSGSGLLFQVYQPVDRTGTMKFSAEMGNLKSWNYKETAPAANHVYSGGQGDLTARAFLEGGDSTSMIKYGRIELFKDQTNAGDAAQLANWLATELAADASQLSVAIETVDSTERKFLRDYGLGDRVSVALTSTGGAGSVSVSNLIRQVTIQWNGQGELVTPLVGTPGDNNQAPLSKTFAAIADLNQRLSRLEAN